MQLDKTRIVVRERSFPDILDLALRIIRGHAGPILFTTLVGIAPFALLNYYLLFGLLSEFDFDFDTVPWNYVFLYAGLLIWEIPLAAAPTTLLLGQLLFQDKPDWRRLTIDLMKSIPQLILFQGVIRAILTFLVITLVAAHGVWPYLNEIVLLERNPLFRRKQGVSTYTRATAMHSANTGDLFGRWLGSLGVSFLLGASILLGAMQLWVLLGGPVEMGAGFWTVAFPVALWCVVGYFNVVRFLSYLDLRIRLEGWEIELRMRAEGARLTRLLA